MRIDLCGMNFNVYLRTVNKAFISLYHNKNLMMLGSPRGHA